MRLKLPSIALIGIACALTAGCLNTIPPNPGANDTAVVRDGPNPWDQGPEPFSEVEKTLSKGRLGGVWESCYASYRVKDGAEKDIERLTNGCAEPTGMKATAPARTGALTEESPPDRVTFVAHPGKCYRVYTTASSTVTDLDVAIMDPDGGLTVLDRSEDGYPVVPGRGPMCLERPGVYTVEVSITAGSGEYAVQVLSD